MIDLDFRRKSNGVPILSKAEIETLAEMVIKDYNPKLLEEPGSLDVEDFAEGYADLEMDYKDLTHNQSILGMTVFCNCYIPIYNAEENKAEEIPVDEGTIIVDNSCFLQVKIPHFCKTFSPGTGGEFFSRHRGTVLLCSR